MITINSDDPISAKRILTHWRCRQRHLRGELGTLPGWIAGGIVYGFGGLLHWKARRILKTMRKFKKAFRRLPDPRADNAHTDMIDVSSSRRTLVKGFGDHNAAFGRDWPEQCDDYRSSQFQVVLCIALRFRPWRL